MISAQSFLITNSRAKGKKYFPRSRYRRGPEVYENALKRLLTDGKDVGTYQAPQPTTE